MTGAPHEAFATIALLKAWWQLRNYSVRGGDLEQRDCELVILRVAVHTKVLLGIVDELIESRGISEPTQERAGKYFTGNQIMDVIAIHGLYVTLACMINTWELELDTHVREHLPDSVTLDTFTSEL